MPAAWAGVAVAAGSAIAKGVGQSGDVSAGAAQANALSQQAINTATTNYNNDRANAQPFITQGTGAVGRLGDLLGLNGQAAADSGMAAFQASPGYGYQVQQGLRAVDAGAASQGMLNSGATIKAEQTLGSNLTNQDYGNYLGRLNTLAGIGVQGSALDNQSTGTLNTLLSGQTTNQVNTTNTAATNNASIYGNTLGSLSNTAGGFLNSNTGQSLLNNLQENTGMGV